MTDVMVADPVVAYVGLGSNLGDRANKIRQAVAHLAAAPGVTVVALSSLLENPAVGGPADSPPFVNAAVEMRTTLPPGDLLRLLLASEGAFGRTRSVRWGPRTLDLDLLFYGDRMIDTPELTVPHPRLQERRFVLQPLAEIAPDVVHPRLGVTVAELLRQLNRSSDRSP